MIVFFHNLYKSHFVVITYVMLSYLFIVFSQVLLFSTLQAWDEIGPCQEEASLRRQHAQSEYP